MVQREAITRTSETGIRTFAVSESIPRAVSGAAEHTGPTEVLPLDAADAAAISFAREREFALDRSEHSASVRRLRRAIVIGGCVWGASYLLDLWITTYTGVDALATLVGLRSVGCLLALNALWWLRGRPEPSARMLWWCDVSVFGGGALLQSGMSIAFGGITSPYATGIVGILVARGATTLAPWRRGAGLFGIPALAYPVVMLIAARFDEQIAAQFRDRLAYAAFVTMLIMILVSWVMLTLGGHFAWQLRREAVETRDIGRYKLERRLGSGGMGEVWAAFDQTLKQRVALKTVPGHRPGSAALMRLEREVRTLAELTHPNTVRIFDYGVTDDGLWYYAMELLHGQNLRQLVAAHGPLAPQRLLRIARQVLRALGEAHDKGIIHRDIKPENVFIAELGGEPDVAKLLDFGIAKATLSEDATLTHTGFVTGTPAYMAPELILGREADVRSDIYSFGATLYYAASGRLPFPEVGKVAQFTAHLQREPEPLETSAPQPIPAELSRVVGRCMAKDPAERYPSTRALLEALAPLVVASPLD